VGLQWLSDDDNNDIKKRSKEEEEQERRNATMMVGLYCFAGMFYVLYGCLMAQSLDF
jgi:hypothetical protein